MTYEDVVAHYGSRKAAMHGLNISPQVLNNWKSRGIPGDAQFKVHYYTDGALPIDKDILGEDNE